MSQPSESGRGKRLAIVVGGLGLTVLLTLAVLAIIFAGDVKFLASMGHLPCRQPHE